MWRISVSILLLVTGLILACHRYQLYQVVNDGFEPDKESSYISTGHFDKIKMTVLGVIVDKTVIKIEVTYENSDITPMLISPFKIGLSDSNRKYSLINIYINDKYTKSLNDLSIEPGNRVEIVYRFQLPSDLEGQVPDLNFQVSNVLRPSSNIEVLIDAMNLRKFD